MTEVASGATVPAAPPPPEPRPARGDVVVCVSAGPAALVAATVAAVRATVPEGTPVVVVDAAPAAQLAAASTAGGRADVVLVAAGCRPAPGWLAALRAAARSDLPVATASPVAPPPGDAAPARPAPASDITETPLAAVARRVPPLSPRLGRPAAHCVLLRRPALELLASEGDDVVAFADRCTAHGLAHLLAPSAAVAPPPDAGPDHGGAAAGDDWRPPVDVAAARVRVALVGLRVTIDARCLRDPLMGTQRVVLGLTGALARRRRVRLRLLLPDTMPADSAAAVEGLPGVGTTTTADVDAGAPRDDVVYRPNQLEDAWQLGWLRRLGERLVLGQLDLIAYHNPAYFPDRPAWLAYRRTTRRGLAAADTVVFASEHVAREAVAEGIVDERRAAVVAPGVDTVDGAGRGSVRPQVRRLLEGDLLLALGTDYLHKNRPFAIRLHAELARSHGWAGRLVLAGVHIAHGSSRQAEAALIDADPGLASTVVDLGPVSEAERVLLVNRARAVLYPSITEGFGLLPFEVAAAGVPCAYAAQASLAEVLPVGAATLVPWDAVESAARLAPLLAPGPPREAAVATVMATGEPLTWDAAAARMEEVLVRAAASAWPLGWDAAEALDALAMGPAAHRIEAAR